MSLLKIRTILEQRRQNRESANTLILYIMWFPLMLFVFGIAVDGAIGTYTVSTLQSGLDTATQSALSRAANPGTNENRTLKPRLTLTQARTNVMNFYDKNRSGGKNPFVICQTRILHPEAGDGINTSSIRLVRPASGCGWTEANFMITGAGNEFEISTTVLERSSTVFMQVVGIKELKYNITSSARVTHEIG